MIQKKVKYLRKIENIIVPYIIFLLKLKNPNFFFELYRYAFIIRY